MTARTDALTLIRSAPAGTALYGREWIDSGASEVAWYLREESARIAALGDGPDIEVRGNVIEYARVLLVPILIRVGEERQENIWETWLNAQQPDNAGIDALGDLAIQPRLVVHFVGDGGQIERSLTRSNPLQSLARDVLARLVRYPEWSMEQFDSARERIYARHPSVMELWRAIA